MPAVPRRSLSLGLANEGHTCYLNSLLQALYHVDAFREGLLRYTDEEGITTGPAAALAGTFREMLGGTGRVGQDPPARTKRLCTSLGVNVRQQEDAQEFKGILFAGLNDAQASGLSPTARAALEAPFRGALRNSISCPDVDFGKTWREPFADLALDVSGANTIEQALSNYFKDEVWAMDTSITAVLK
jgi:ubiquitin carboxyl-terminal hydrolase 7